MKYLFILGRNPELSRLEILSFLKRVGNSVLVEERENNGLMLELENTLDAGTVDLLGGTIGIGVVLCEIKDLDKKHIYYGTSNNFNYLLWNFSEKTSGVSEYLKRRFRYERLRATEKRLDNLIKTQDGGTISNSSSNLISEEYFVFKDLFGRIVQKCNYKDIEIRDMQKPVRRENLSIPPRLAKIMINLSEIKEDEVLLDAFCGIGVILIEALNMDIKSVGIDRDKKAIDGATRNIEWFKFSRENYKLVNNDSSKIKISPVNVLVSEPDFGKTFRKSPGKKEAEEIIKKFEDLMIRVLTNLRASVFGKIVFSAPYINVGRERVGCNFSKICEKIGLNLEKGFPISEFREDQIVGRQIVVMK